MMGAGGAGASGQAKALLAGIDILGKVKSVEDQCTSMASYLDRKRKQGPITWAALRDDAEFWVECTKLATSIASAVALGVTSEKGAAGTVKKILDTVAPYLKAGEATAKVAQIIQILNDPKLPPKVKEEKAAKIVGELIAMAFDLVGEKAKKADESRAKQAEESKARVEKAREQIRKEVASGFDEKAAAGSPRDAGRGGRRRHARRRPDPAPDTWRRPRPPARTTSRDARPRRRVRQLHRRRRPAHDRDERPGVPRAAGRAAPVPVKSEALDPATLRGTHGMPEGNQQKIQEVADKMGVVIDVRPTTAAAPAAARPGRGPEVRGPQVEDDRRRRQAARRDRGRGRGRVLQAAGPGRPRRLDGGALVAARHGVLGQRGEDDRAAEAGRRAARHQERQAGRGRRRRRGPGRRPRGRAARRRSPATTTSTTSARPTARPLTREEYVAVLKALKEGGMGVEHGAHTRWAEDKLASGAGEMTPADKLIFDAIVKRHASGKEPLLRFAPGKAPVTAAPAARTRCSAPAGRPPRRPCRAAGRRPSRASSR